MGSMSIATMFKVRLLQILACIPSSVDAQTTDHTRMTHRGSYEWLPRFKPPRPQQGVELIVSIMRALVCDSS